MKLFIVFVMVGVVVLPPISTVYAEPQPPDIGDCDCDSWVNYESRSASWYEYNMKKLGFPVDQQFKEAKALDAKSDKMAYFAGLMDAYSMAVKVTNNLTLGKWRSYAEIDEICAKPENKRRLVKELMLKDW